jgi:predicted nucleic acid-binding protein
VAGRRRSRSLKTPAVPGGVVLDSAALSAAAHGDVRVRAELTIAEQLGVDVHASAVTLAEVLRGHRRDAGIHRLLAGVVTKSVTPTLGRAAGELLGRTKRDDTVDAIVAVTADGLGIPVRLLTGDPADLRALTAEMDYVTIVAI